MEAPGWVAVPLVVWLASGLAALALAPRNRSSWALAATGATWTVSWFGEGVRPLPEGAALSLLTSAVDVAFLLGLTGVVALLATYPGGAFVVRWHRAVVAGLGAVAVLAPVARLLGSPTLPIPGEDVTFANPVGWHELEQLGAAGEALIATEPGWILVGLALLALRLRSGNPRRSELRPLLRAVAVLVALLLLFVSAAAAGRPVPDAVAEPAFLVALAALPLVLLRGITRRIRVLDEQLAASRTRLVEAEDRARRSIERDLHDGVQQQLVALLPLVELAERQAARGGSAVGTTLRDVRDQVTAAITDLRELVSGIRPPVLEDAGVAAALESRFARLPVTLELERSGHRWPPEVESAAYFVACEGVGNALKHARGAPVAVRLEDDGHRLVLEVEDRGPGLAGAPAGRGLSGLQDRVESLGGRFTAGPGARGPGARVRAEFVRERS